ncbi:MAG TPA: hypothetical protein VF598_12795 [Hymenobacter sp.]|jgi:hypothetical protein
MKTVIIFCLGLFLCLVSTMTQAHTRPIEAALPGYWNIETNLTTRDYTIVRFYDGQDQLAYEERLPNLCLDLSRTTGICRRTARQLNVALQQVLRNPALGAQSATLLAQQFSVDRRLQRAYAVRRTSTLTYNP